MARYVYYQLQGFYYKFSRYLTLTYFEILYKTLGSFTNKFFFISFLFSERLEVAKAAGQTDQVEAVLNKVREELM